MMASFYGQNIEQVSRTKTQSKTIARKNESNEQDRRPNDERANSVNITQFMILTRPSYVIYSCSFGSQNCENIWKPVRTFQGQCLAINVNDLPSYGSNDW